MKRRDWKKRKLERNIFGNFVKKKKSRYFLKNIYFLRKLYMRKNRILVKKNLAMNFIFYKKLHNSVFFKMNRYIHFHLFKSLRNSIEVFPLFFLTKKIFQNQNNFLHFLKQNNFNYFFLKNFNNELYKNNLKVFVFGDNINSIVKYSRTELVNLFNNNEVNSCLYKSDFISKQHDIINILNFNYHFNYNIFIINLIEIYKITIILYMFKLNK